MAGLMLSVRAHNAAGGFRYGPGGPRCTCCAPAPKARKMERRRVRRAEAQAWKGEARNA
jgi:hypothetical protein